MPDIFHHKENYRQSHTDHSGMAHSIRGQPNYCRDHSQSAERVFAVRVLCCIVDRVNRGNHLATCDLYNLSNAQRRNVGWDRLGANMPWD